MRSTPHILAKGFRFEEVLLLAERGDVKVTCAVGKIRE